MWLSNKLKRIRYEVNWNCCDGREGLYTTDTLKELREKIINDSSLHECEKSWLMFGYCKEFIKDIFTEHYCIDNGFCINWYKYKII